MTLLQDRRVAVLEAAGATPGQRAELLLYGTNAFVLRGQLDLDDFPLPDEPFVDGWEALRDQLPPLSNPEALTMQLHATAAGRIPVIATSWRPDFEILVHVLTRRAATNPVPASMGASMVSRRRQGETFATRFILVSHGPYSGVPAARVGLDGERWRALSLTIRIEHECAHYFTRRVLGSMTNALLDELIADYAGIVAATGAFRADWFLEFMRDRLANYRGSPPLSDGAFGVLRSLVRDAAVNVQRFDDDLPADRSMRVRVAAVLALATLSVEELADTDAPERLAASFHAIHGDR
jgi:hypothetical protein